MTSKRLNRAYEDFVAIPVMAVIGLYIVSILIDVFIDNSTFAFALKGGGIFLAILVYYKGTLEKYLNN